MPSKDARDLQPEIGVLSQKFLALASKQGLSLRITQTLRSWEEQDALYQQGRTTTGPIVTKAKAGSSFHNYGLAFDVCFVGPDPFLEVMAKTTPAREKMAWSAVGTIGRDLGLMWGGDFKSIQDRPHFEIKGLTISEAKQLWPKGWKPGVSTLSQLKATQSVSPTVKGVEPVSKGSGKESIHV